MKLSMGTLWEAVLLLLAGFLLLQGVGLQKRMGEARDYFDSVVRALEESGGEESVRQAVLEDAADRGYSLQLEPLGSDDRYTELALVLEYPLWGRTASAENGRKGRISGYARP